MQIKNPVEPFGEVDIEDVADGSRKVRATILMEPAREGAVTGLAIDGSGSMKSAFGATGMVSSLFASASVNQAKPVIQQICSYLVTKIDADGATSAIYWATGPAGAQIEELGDLDQKQAESFDFKGPKLWGTGTQLLPALKYFAERYKSASWGIFVFVSDGILDDLDAVKDFTRQLAKDIDVGRRFPVKLVLVGLGAEVDERQMEELDDLDTGTDVDLWDHKLARDMRNLAEIFAEVIDDNVRVADHGIVKDAKGKVVKNYSDTGLPALLQFVLPADAKGSFSLEVAGQTITQTL